MRANAFAAILGFVALAASAAAINPSRPVSGEKRSLSKRAYQGISELSICGTGLIPSVSVCCSSFGWCPTGTQCSGIKCKGTCPTTCGTYCTDVSYDFNNCGKCGNVCPDPVGKGYGYCHQGQCTMSCVDGYTLTAGKCSNGTDTPVVSSGPSGPLISSSTYPASHPPSPGPSAPTSYTPSPISSQGGDSWTTPVGSIASHTPDDPTPPSSASGYPLCPAGKIMEYQDSTPSGAKIWGYSSTTAPWWIKCSGCQSGSVSWIEMWKTGKCSGSSPGPSSGSPAVPTDGPVGPVGPSGLPTCPAGKVMEYQNLENGVRTWGYSSTSAPWWRICAKCGDGKDVAWIQEWKTGKCDGSGPTTPTSPATSGYPLCPVDKPLVFVKETEDGKWVWKLATGSGPECSGCPGQGQQTVWDAGSKMCRTKNSV